MLKRFEKNQREQDELEKNLPEEEKFQKESETTALEEMLDETNAKQGINEVYKLFNLICKQNPDQILRYFQPVDFRDQQQILEPLWASSKNQFALEKVPCCPKCNQARAFELQIMP